MNSAKVSIVIPTWNTQRWLPGCLDGLRAQKFRDFQIVVVDNGSTDNSVEYIRQHYPEVELILFEDNRGFAKAVNAGINHHHTEYVVLLNVDTIPQPNWLAELVATIEHSGPDVGSVASKMLSMSDPEILDDAGISFSWYGSTIKRGKGKSAQLYTKLEEVFCACAGAALYRRSFLEQVGLFDEKFITYLEDVDLGLRGQMLGYRCLYVPTAEIWHKWHGAELPRPTYVYYNTRNRLTLLLQDVPGALLRKHWRHILYGQFYFFLVYKKPIQSLRGYLAFFTDLPGILRQRKETQQRNKISPAQFDVLLSLELGEPPLAEIIKNKLGRKQSGDNQ
jgi:hypothetical protein